MDHVDFFPFNVLIDYKLITIEDNLELNTIKSI